MAVDPAFVEAGRQVGMEIWRIEKLQVVAQDPKTYGEFYTGDSYIVLSTKKDQNSAALRWDLHFWLGSTTSQDEKGIAAYKTVELDDSLGGGPVQYREVEGHETKLFLSYFKKGIKYLDGGVDSGFKKVERDKYVTKLMHVKGKKNIRVKQVPLDITSLNQGDVFILDAGLTIYVWNGPDSSRWERIKACEVARRIKDEERGGRAQLKIIEDKWETHGGFFRALGTTPGPITTAEEAGDDEGFEKQQQEAIKLYRVTDASGETEIKEVMEKPLKRKQLESEDCFILDTGPSGIFVWTGKDCTKNEKKEAWKHATDFLTARGYPDYTAVTQVNEDGETPLFKENFPDWPVANAQVGMGQVHKKERIASYSNEKFDSKTLHQRKKKAEEKLPDDGRGHVKVWRIENNEMVPQPEDTYGVFYTGDCYVIQYTYKKAGKEKYIIYFWQGAKSTTDERGASAIYAQRLDDDELKGEALQVRVVQSREPEHFLRIFRGRTVIFMGGINNTEPDSKFRLFQIRGTNEFNTKAVQVIPRAASLNSNDVFIVDEPPNVIIWYGKGASEQECQLAKSLIAYLFPDNNSDNIEEVYEGEEKKTFWKTLGGKEEYASGKLLERQNSEVPPRLFQCSNASGKFNVEEIDDFSQEDMSEEDVMILDTIDEVYVWIGRGANDIEKKESLLTAMEYIKNDPTGRNPDNTVILQVKQGLEPPAFTGHFMAWDPKWSKGKTFSELKKEMGKGAEAVSVEEELKCYDQKHSYEDLQSSLLPKGVDACNKERHLKDEDFVDVFKMTYLQFSALQKWKQISLKKKVNLY